MATKTTSGSKRSSNVSNDEPVLLPRKKHTLYPCSMSRSRRRLPIRPTPTIPTIPIFFTIFSPFAPAGAVKRPQGRRLKNKKNSIFNESLLAYIVSHKNKKSMTKLICVLFLMTQSDIYQSSGDFFCRTFFTESFCVFYHLFITYFIICYSLYF